MTGFTLTAILSLSLSLVLALRAWRSHGMSFENTAWMAVAWTILITVVAFVAGRLAG